MGFLNGSLKVSTGVLQKLFAANGSFCVAYRVRGRRTRSSGGIAKRSGIIAQVAEVKGEREKNLKSQI